MMRRASSAWARFGWMVSGAAIAIVAYEAGKARADGAPKSEPLVYSGHLTDDENAPVADGERAMAVALFDAATGGAALCRTPVGEGATKEYPVKGGHFSVTLDEGCTGAVQANSEVWVEVAIEGTVMPRTKIAAVPYALEAETAATARALSAAGVAATREALADLRCPSGYTEITVGAEKPTVCQRGPEGGVLDQMVLVGAGRGAFWIDRYEASVWDSDDDPAKSYDGDYPPTFPRNGQIEARTDVLFARSAPDVLPSTSLTWFQANLACLASGKRLPTGSEWSAAAAGTGDAKGLPPAACNTDSDVKRVTNAPGCASVWGVEDMIGNAGEMLADWQFSANTGISPNAPADAWGPDYGDALTYSVHSYAVNDVAALKFGLPAVEIRGGTFGTLTVAKLFQVSASFGASTYNAEVGFRCVIPR
jgi:hypothetical protein